MTMEELLTHYQANNTGVLSTFVAPNNIMVPYNSHYPVFQSAGPPVAPSPPDSPSPPNTPIAFNSDLTLPDDQDGDICLSDYSDSEDSKMMDCSSDEGMELSSDLDDSFSRGLYDFGLFLGPHKDDSDNEDGHSNGISVMATNGYSEVHVIMEDHRHLAST